MIHVLYDEMTVMTALQAILCCFIVHEKISNLSGPKLSKFQIVCSKAFQISNFGVKYHENIAHICWRGMHAASAKNERKSVLAFYDKVNKAYLELAKYLQMKLPLQSNLLRHLSTLDPRAQGYQKTHEYLKKLLHEMKCYNLTNSQIDQYNLQALSPISNRAMWQIHGSDIRKGKVSRKGVCMFLKH